MCLKYLLILLLSMLPTLLNADDIAKMAKELNLYPGTKASIQWERVFSSERRLKKYAIFNLSESQKIALKTYLIKYAADSDQPIVPGL